MNKKIFNLLITAVMMVSIGLLTSCKDETDSQWEMDHPDGWTEEMRGNNRFLYPANGAGGDTFVVEHIEQIKSDYFNEKDFKETLSDEMFEKGGFTPVSEIEAGSDNFLNYKYQREFETPDGHKGIRAVGFAKDKVVYVEGFGTAETFPEVASTIGSLRLSGISPNDYFLKNFNNFFLLVLFVITIFDGLFVCESIQMKRKRPSDRGYYSRAIKVGCAVFAAVLATFVIILLPCPQLMWKYVLSNIVIFGLFVAFGMTIFMRKLVETVMG